MVNDWAAVPSSIMVAPEPLALNALLAVKVRAVAELSDKVYVPILNVLLATAVVTEPTLALAPNVMLVLTTLIAMGPLVGIVEAGTSGPVVNVLPPL